MKNMKVSAKLILGFTIVAVLTGIVGAVGIYGMSRLAETGRQMYESNLLASEAMSDIREAFQQERVYLRDISMYLDNPDIVNMSIESMDEAHLRGDAAVNRYMAAITDESQEGDFLEAGALLNGPYYTAKEDIVQAARLGDKQAVLDGIEEARQYVSTIEANLASAEKRQVAQASEQYAANKVLSRALTLVQCAIIFFACLTAVLLGIYISRLISKPLHSLTAFMNKAGDTGDIALQPEDIEVIDKFSVLKDEIGQCISSCAKFVRRLFDVSNMLETVANGDLTAELALLSDEDAIGLSLRKMLGNLNEMFHEINTATSHVSLGAGQISGSAQSLAQGSTEQASAVDELSSSVNNIAEKTKQNAHMAKEAASLSHTIKDSAVKGNKQMDQMMRAVRDINDASGQIEKVIKVIDDIAFQTNILALNAAVEAARAGTVGKGFAVVAEEVRNLAAKSAEAAKNTGDLIENSVTKANLGLAIATETSSSLKEIVDGINRSAELVEQIAVSSDGQAAAISQINIGIDQVAQVVQQNSATAEENAAASEEMNTQSRLLSHTIAQFKLKDGYPSAHTVPIRLTPIPKGSGTPEQRLPVAGSGSGEWGKY